ncbi:MAG TPA: Cys-tRNA(Pro) deacylase [Firmicutes bacterium]|nr:Cys-tRNA(Pro) deacylase [Bacillota bacterium]
MRALDKAHIPYRHYAYPVEDGHIDGAAVAAKLGQNPEQVFKTLVTKGAGGGYFVFVIPVAKELDLKAAARAVGEKSVSMIPVAEINRVTGYIRGGCSPIGMKKRYPTVVDESSLEFDTIIFSAGRIGAQVEVAPKDLLGLIGGKTAPITAHTA